MEQHLLIASYMEQCFPRYISSIGIREESQVDITVESFNLLILILCLYRDPFLRYKILVDLWIVDYPNERNRFQVNYILGTALNITRLRLIVYTSTYTYLYSLATMFKAGNWLEREAYDLYGVFFTEHPDLRRILTDYGFEGYPMKKDFPVGGYVQVRYDDETKKIVVQPIEYSQEFRNYKFSTPWKDADA